MAGSEEYQIERCVKLEASLELLIKTHYRRKGGKKYLPAFEALLETFLLGLKNDPRPHGSQAEKYPRRCQIPEGFEFRKMRWRSLPGLNGSSSKGGLMYVIFEPRKLVFPFWIYTHAEYSDSQSRPPDREILETLKQIICLVQASQADKQLGNGKSFQPVIEDGKPVNEPRILSPQEFDNPQGQTAQVELESE